MTESPDDDHFRDLAIARDRLSRALAESGRTAEAIDERQLALEIWEILAVDHPKNLEYRDHQVNTLNDLAWLLATNPNPSPRDPARAAGAGRGGGPDLVRSRRLVEYAGRGPLPGRRLGRRDRSPGAVRPLGPDGGGTAFDHYFLAMAWYQLHREDQAGEWLERGIAWAARHRPGHPELERFRQETESVLRS